MEDIQRALDDMMKQVQNNAIKQGAKAAAMTVLEKIDGMEANNVSSADIVEEIKNFCVKFYGVQRGGQNG
ncbi:MAG TPA: hypothetical protein DCW90_21245 [Lachnospiraceae bacterium]|nr:hypothetical protein [Lachnospiraceae bacterium]